jgi:hypothetical protein
MCVYIQGYFKVNYFSNIACTLSNNKLQQYYYNKPLMNSKLSAILVCNKLIK